MLRRFIAVTYNIQLSIIKRCQFIILDGHRHNLYTRTVPIRPVVNRLQYWRYNVRSTLMFQRAWRASWYLLAWVVWRDEDSRQPRSLQTIQPATLPTARPASLGILQPAFPLDRPIVSPHWAHHSTEHCRPINEPFSQTTSQPSLQ